MKPAIRLAIESVVWAAVMIGMLLFGVAIGENNARRDEASSYNKGFNAALDASRPSERLEAVCAALWFKGNTRNDNNN